RGDLRSRVTEAMSKPEQGRRCRVEVWRGGLGRCLCSLLACSFVCGCHIISTMLRFHTPLIKPGGRFSRTRLSDKACEIAIHTRSHTNRCRFVPESWCSPSFWCRYWLEKRFFPCPCSLNFAHNHWRTR